MNRSTYVDIFIYEYMHVYILNKMHLVQYAPSHPEDVREGVRSY